MTRSVFTNWKRRKVSEVSGLQQAQNFRCNWNVLPPKDYAINTVAALKFPPLLRFLLALFTNYFLPCFLFSFFNHQTLTMVYLIHFSRKLQHAQHYIGFVKGDLMQRIELHLNNRGAKLLATVNNQGIRWQVVRVWLEGDRHFERKLKDRKKSRRYCPIYRNNHQCFEKSCSPIGIPMYYKTSSLISRKFWDCQ